MEGVWMSKTWEESIWAYVLRWRRVAAEKPLLVECKEDRRLLSQHS